MSKSKTSNRYNQEFKDSAVNLAIKGEQPMTKTAKDLGVNINTLNAWVRKSCSEQGEASSGAVSVLEENKRLRRELKLVKEEREILKKAAAYFAKESL